jgi:hypothetical protein
LGTVKTTADKVATNRSGRWDGPAWGLVIVISLFACAIGCFGVAVAQSRSLPQADIMTTEDCPLPPDL